MKLQKIQIVADRSIVDDFPNGFVSKFERDSLCIVGPLSNLIQRKIDTECYQNLYIKATPGIDSVRMGFPIEVPFDFKSYLTATEGEKRSKLLHAVDIAFDSASLNLSSIANYIEVKDKFIAAGSVWTYHLRPVKLRDGIRFQVCYTPCMQFGRLYIELYKAAGQRIEIDIANLIPDWEWSYRFRPRP